MKEPIYRGLDPEVKKRVLRTSLEYARREEERLTKAAVYWINRVQELERELVEHDGT